MRKKYKEQNVFDAFQERIKFIFEEFDNIYISFSGGKDSGLLLNLVIKYMRENGIKKKIGVFHQDFEAQYTLTTEYVERTLLNNNDLIEPFWCCLPMQAGCNTSQYQDFWVSWCRDEQDKWCREMPNHDCVINFENKDEFNFDFYYENMLQEDLYDKFSEWYHNKHCKNQGKTICLIGIRADESFNRYRAVIADKRRYKNQCWTTGKDDGTWIGYPLYDWKTDDVWIANGKFGFDYNKIYDIFYQAGLKTAQMRVASPFHYSGVANLNLYRVIEPKMWHKFLARVSGANFTAIYGNTKAFAWKNIQKPEKMETWKEFVHFLIDTLPEKTAENYKAKFKKSIDFWMNKGGILSTETVKNLQKNGYKCHFLEGTNKVVFGVYPDDVNMKEFAKIPSYKRMAICIMKNDHRCQYMGFAPTKSHIIAKNTAMALNKARSVK